MLFSAGIFTGSYENSEYVQKNSYHYIDITKKENGEYQWENQANVKWMLVVYDWNELKRLDISTYPSWEYAAFNTEGAIGVWNELYEKVSGNCLYI